MSHEGKSAALHSHHAKKESGDGLPSLEKKPIIVLGNQKSGTTAIAALLSEYAGLSVTLDIMGIYGLVKERLHSGLMLFSDFVEANKADFSRGVIKEPELTFLYDKVVSYFPASKYVIIVRDPRDNIRSILNRLSIRGDLEDIDPEKLLQIHPEWRKVLHGQWMGLEGATYIEQLAYRWNRAIDIYLRHSESMTLFRYEDFLKNKAVEIERLAKTFGLKKVNDITDKVDVQYQPKGDRSVSLDDFFGVGNLLKINRICADQMKKLCYA